MTKTVLVTNLKEINNIKFVCRKCDASFIVPLNKSNLPQECFSCGNGVGRKNMEKLLGSFKQLVLISDAQDFDLIVETEQK